MFAPEAITILRTPRMLTMEVCCRLLFAMKAGRFYLQLAREVDRPRVPRQIAKLLGASQRVFVGVIDPISPEIETPERVRARVMEAVSVLPLDRFGTTDDCGFSPFGDDVSTARDVA